MKSFFANKFFIILIVIALFLIGIMLYEFTGTSNIAEQTGGSIVSPVQSGASGIRNFFSSFFTGAFNYNNIKAENDELRSKLTQAESDLAQAQGYADENEHLRDILELKEKKPDLILEKARVVTKDPGDWFDIYTIDKGSMSGVKVNCPVITSYGLAGVVKEVGLNYAKVVSIINTESVVGAVVPRTNDIAIVDSEFELYKKGLCKMNFIDSKININIGDIVESSGLGGIFPNGLRIGRIEDIMPDTQGTTRYAVIRPAVDFSKLRTVFVIKDFDGMEEYSMEDKFEKKQ